MRQAFVLLGCIVVASSGFAPHAADTPQSTKDSNLVTVLGCLHGLEVTTFDETGTNGVPPQRFRLTGNREMLHELKKHSGHFEEIRGTLTSGTANGGLRTSEKRIPKGRIYAGVGSTPFERPGTTSDPGATSTVQLRTFAHLADRCG
jgi:hypothetical protein